MDFLYHNSFKIIINNNINSSQILTNNNFKIQLISQIDNNNTKINRINNHFHRIMWEE